MLFSSQRGQVYLVGRKEYRKVRKGTFKKRKWSRMCSVWQMQVNASDAMLFRLLSHGACGSVHLWIIFQPGSLATSLLRVKFGTPARWWSAASRPAWLNKKRKIDEGPKVVPPYNFTAGSAYNGKPEHFTASLGSCWGLTVPAESLEHFFGASTCTSACVCLCVYWGVELSSTVDENVLF